jgi:transposase
MKVEVMARAYSSDLRKRVYEAYKKSKDIRRVCKRFSISLATGYRWVQAKRTRNTLEPIKQRHVGHSHKIRPEEFEEFVLFVQKNIGLNGKQLAEKWGRGMTPKSMREWLKKLGFTRKKNNFYIQNETKQSEMHSKQN